jgi:nucleotide-binding universal stress UspA family protein
MKKILVAYDATEPADSALQTAIELAKGFSAEVGVVSVVPVHPGRAPIDPWDDREVHAAQIARARKLLLEKGIEPQVHYAYGDPAHAIEETAEQHGYDTIVVGSRGLNMVGRMLQGSVSEHVATHAKETVIVAR